MTRLLPGAYLYRSRIGTPRALVSYLWLELAPSAVAGWVSQGIEAALWFVVCHCAVLGLYELGYIANDRAPTAGERSARFAPSSAASGFVFALVRIACLTGLSWAVAARFDLARAAQFAVTTVCVLALLMAHTWVGARIGLGAPARIITFAWLAAFKYLPANLASAGPRAALELCLVLFLLYGGGRVLEYALDKHRATVSQGLVGVNAAWLLSTLPLAAVLSFTGAAKLVLSCLAVIGSHHLVVLVVRSLPGRAHSPQEGRGADA